MIERGRLRIEDREKTKAGRDGRIRKRGKEVKRTGVQRLDLYTGSSKIRYCESSISRAKSLLSETLSFREKTSGFQCAKGPGLSV